MAKKSKSTITIRTQFAVTTTLVLLLVILGLFVAVLDGGNKKVGAPAAATEAVSFADVTVKGVATCLPKVGTGAQTMECALGVKTASGVYYAVESDEALTVDQEVELTGTVEEAVDSSYDIAGTVVVE